MDDGVVLLGVPRRRTPEGETALDVGRPAQFAAYLAVRGDWVGREELIALLWPDSETRQARHTLSQLLYQVRRTPWGRDVAAEPTRVRWPVPCDVTAFRTACSEGAWQRAVDLYGGDLMHGVPADGQDRFDAWLRSERDHLRETWRAAMQARAETLADQGRWSDGARLLRQLLVSDELSEQVVQLLMRCEARAGRREAALQVYEAFCARLRIDLSLDPLDATVALAADVRAGVLGPEASPGPQRTAQESTLQAPSPQARAVHGAPPDAGDRSEARDVRPGPVRNLETDPTPFVGRTLELAELHQLLHVGSHRLVTLLGPGGVGKSRVAAQLTRERSGHHEEGAVWVSLATVSDAAGAIAAIVRALGLSIDPEPDALIGVLSSQDRLLALDAAEHVGDVSGLALALLDGCPDLTVLATSRTPLDVPGEAIVPLSGLSVPPRDDADDAEAYDAVGLLLRSARRVRPLFQPHGAERTAAVALTRLLGGSPLALELAAAWLRMLAPSELLAEVRRDLDVLATRGAPRDPRHASVRAVFESSWSLLRPDERDALRQLAVFRGGCTRDGAED
ncbi:MAG: BTAD domain-containing putative transcriptional regulator, partial [Trueperaceae bacterium]